MANEVKCIWAMGTPCSDNGDCKEHEIFAKQLKVPMCQNHLEEHTHIMVLAANGYDVETILQETAEYRKGEVLVLQLAGLDTTKVEI